MTENQGGEATRLAIQEVTSTLRPEDQGKEGTKILEALGERSLTGAVACEERIGKCRPFKPSKRAPPIFVFFLLLSTATCYGVECIPNVKILTASNLEWGLYLRTESLQR